MHRVWSPELRRDLAGVEQLVGRWGRLSVECGRDDDELASR